jgi:glycosyltransferase involved in cell wall biosynthesis
MKILMAADVPRRREGGVAGIVMNYAEGLEKRGHSVTTLFSGDLSQPGVHRGRFAELNFASRLADYIRRRRDDFSIVNLHAPAGVVYGFRRRYLRTSGPPYVMTLHGLEENRVYALTREARKGRAWHFTAKNCVWHRLYHQPRFAWAIRTADAAHCFSRDVWTLLRLKYDLDDDRVACIPNGVAERFFIQRNYHSRSALRLLYAGTWLDQRGIFYLRDALPRIFAALPDLRMTFAGPGVPPGEILNFYGQAVSARLDIVETIPWENMPQLYAEHDILLFPSLIEGQPSVVLEAMAGGMPVVTTETCGMVDAIEHGWSGWLVPPADSAAIENAVLRLAASADLREKIGRAAQERMRRQTWEAAVTRFEELLLQTLARSKRP